MVRRSIEHELRSRNFEARSGDLSRTCWSKNRREQRRVHKGQGDCWQWQASGQCLKGDQCSFRQDGNKRAKVMTQPTPSPEQTTQSQVGKNARSKSRGGRSLSGGISRLPCKDHLKGTCTNPSCEEWHSPEYKTRAGCKFGCKCVFAHRKVGEQPSRRSIKNGDKSAVAVVKDKRIGLCISGHGAAEVFIDFFGRAQPCGNQSEVFDSLKPHCAMPKFETEIHRSTTFVQANLISETRTLQNLRIGLRKRRNGKSIGLAK